MDSVGISDLIDDNLAKYHLSRFKNFISPMNDEPSKINVSGSNFSKLYPELEKNIKYLNAEIMLMLILIINKLLYIEL